MKPDKRDRHILYILDRDARTPFNQIGSETKLSRQTVRYRVNRMEDEGVIKGYYTMIDHACLGYTSYRTYLKLQNTAPSQRQTLIQDLCEHPDVWAVVSTQGTWDVAIVTATQDVHTYHDAWEEILDDHLPRIDTSTTTIYSPVHHYTRNYLGDSGGATERTLGKTKDVAIDSKDQELLRLLCDDARMTYVDLAQALDLSAQTIKRRLRSLEDNGVIEGYRPIIDVERLGYEFYKVELTFSELPDKNRFLRYCKEDPNVYQVSEVIGGAHIDIEIHVQSLKDMVAKMNDLKSSFPDTIRNYDYLRILDVHKNTFYPEGT